MASIWLGAAILGFLQVASTARIQPAASLHRYVSQGRHRNHSARLEAATRLSDAHANYARHATRANAEQRMPIHSDLAANRSQISVQAPAAREAGSLVQRFANVIVGGPSEGNRLRVAVAMVIAGFAIVACFGLCFFGVQTDSGRKSKEARNKYVHNDDVVYEWDQTDRVMSLYLKPPAAVKKHNIEVIVWPQEIRIGRKQKQHAFLEETLYALVDADSSTWRFARTGELEVHLQKVEKAMWPCVMLAHDPNTKRCDPGA